MHPYYMIFLSILRLTAQYTFRIGGEPILNDTPFGIALLNEYFSSLQADNIPYEDSQKYMHVYMHQAFDIVNNNSIYLPDRPVVRQEIFWSLYVWHSKVGISKPNLKVKT